MGLERTATVRIGATTTSCTVQLEAKEIVCRGALRRKLPLDRLRDLQVRDGQLRFACDGEPIAIDLGEAAAAWLDRIRNPRSRVQKLGIVAGQRVVVLGAVDADAVAEIAAALGAPPKTRLAADCDVVLCGCDDLAGLDRLPAIAGKLAANGAVWVLWPKGRKELAHEHVVAAATRAGLSSTRSMGFSDRLTGLRFVRRKA